MLLEIKSLGSILKINTFDIDINPELIKKIKNKISSFESKYSRFLNDNFLHKLNESGKSNIDEEFKTLFRVSKMLNNLSKGYFDITVLPLLENLGYGIEKQKQIESFGMSNIEINENTITLKNNVKIEFGSLGKGYIVDYIYGLLRQEIQKFTIDFGGDIKVGNQKELVGLEDPMNNNKIIGEIILSNESLCSSNGQKRHFGKNHHLINPFLNSSQNDKISVYVKHKSATLADGFSTALFVTPLELSIEILEKTQGLEGMIITQNGEIFKSKGFDVKLY
ncbi:MAG: FAD:protein FMN transferase [Candidatus Gracilibacteria bacterium]|nr:FAD:protein FMN transferase [Candidatus Gracilibacteria bacterium]